MKKLFAVLVAAVLVLGLGAGTAQALNLNIGDLSYLGKIVDGTPAGKDNETAYVNYLKGLAPSANVGPITLAPYIDNQYFTRSSNGFNYPNLPTAVYYDKYDPPKEFTSLGFQYILGKYGQGETHVWYSQTGFVGSIVVQANSPQGQALSHITVFNSTSVPDGGATLMLLGGALVGLGALRRKFRA